MAEELVKLDKVEISKDGTKASGFVRGGQNKPPRECGNCIWFGLDSCGHPSVEADPELKQRDDGRVTVDDDDCCDSFQSRGNVIVYVVRHGSTKFNDENAFRGWINVDLDEKGVKQAKLARKFMQGKKIKAVYASDLNRAVQTAAHVAPNRKADKDFGLRPWDVGMFTGKPKDEHQEALNHYIDNPEEAIPLGESLKDFAGRMKKAYDKYVKLGREEGPILVVCHSSNAIQLQKQVDGSDELGRPEDEELVPPGGVMALLDEDGIIKTEVIFGNDVEKPASYGS